MIRKRGSLPWRSPEIRHRDRSPMVLGHEIDEEPVEGRGLCRPKFRNICGVEQAGHDARSSAEQICIGLSNQLAHQCAKILASPLWLAAMSLERARRCGSLAFSAHPCTPCSPGFAARLPKERRSKAEHFSGFGALGAISGILLLAAAALFAAHDRELPWVGRDPLVDQTFLRHMSTHHDQGVLLAIDGLKLKQLLRPAGRRPASGIAGQRGVRQGPFSYRNLR